MAETVVKIKLTRDASIPKYETAGSAGFDLVARFNSAEDIKSADGPVAVIGSTLYVSPGQRVIIPTGLSIEIPECYEGQVRCRSGLTFKKGLVVLNSPGTIDSDYRGEIGVLMANLSNTVQSIQLGDRIAQLVISKVRIVTDWVIEDDLQETKRGEGGFGSTGQ
jgi:dUTP pyrophosphatase